MVHGIWKIEIRAIPFGLYENQWVPICALQYEIGITRGDILLHSRSIARPRENVMQNEVDYPVPGISFVKRAVFDVIDYFAQPHQNVIAMGHSRYHPQTNVGQKCWPLGCNVNRTQDGKDWVR